MKNRKSQALGANEIFGEVQSVSEAKSLYINLAVTYSYETELEIWAGFLVAYLNLSTIKQSYISQVL